jgi:glycosyltransferase
VQAEHILVDGGSTDGTLDVVREHGAHLAQVISERDEGIYDAMNKGIAIASGEITGTMNADDFYAHGNVLEMVAEAFRDSSVHACYGDLDYVGGGGKVVRRWRSGHCDRGRIFRGWMPPHPTFFVRRELYQRYGAFNTALGTAADYELMLRFLLKHEVKTAYIPEVLVKMRTGGVSNASLLNRLRANKMDRRAWEINGLKPHPWTIAMKPLRKVGQFLRLPEGRG